MSRLGAFLVLLGLLAGCAADGRVRVLSPDELPQDIYASPTPGPTAAPARLVRVFFLRDDRLEAVTRTASGADDLTEFVVRALLTGPFAEEMEAGISTAVPEGAELLEISMEESVAWVNLSKEFELSAEERILLLRLGQVVYTLTDLGRVDAVRFLIDGEPVDVIAEDGTPHEEVGREDYPTLERGPEPTPEPEPEAEG